MIPAVLSLCYLFNASYQVFNITDLKLHSVLRKRLATIYSVSTLLTLESRMQEVTDVMRTRLRTVARQGVVNIQE